MEARRVILSAALLVVCAIAVQAQAAPAQPEPAQEQIVKEPFEADRSKRQLPLAYTAPAVGSVHAYSYLARYPNSVSGVHYPAPVYAAAAPVISAYHAPVVGAYHAPIVSAYHAPVVGAYHAPLVY